MPKTEYRFDEFYSLVDGSTMFRNFVVLFAIVRSVFNVVFSHTVDSTAKVVYEVTVTWGIFSIEITWLVGARESGIFGKDTRWIKSSYIAYFSYNATYKDWTNIVNGLKDNKSIRG